MSNTLRNTDLEIRIDGPDEHYTGTRFDRTGKITAVIFQGIQVSTGEDAQVLQNPRLGCGFYNEFGIDEALGFEEAPVGGWFHKIGVGLLQKENAPYDFHHRYLLRPAQFTVEATASHVIMLCRSESMFGYAYVLEKQIELLANGFTIYYRLQNMGEKAIHTTEYTHNFLAFGGAAIGPAYRLNFPFDLQPASFGKTLNPNGVVKIRERDIGFTDMPDSPFFFSNLTGGIETEASWELTHAEKQIGIRETGSFKSNTVNLWGIGHVISPELFHSVALLPGRAATWSRTYNIFRTT